MELLHYGIIAIGYNRPESLKRLLTALNRADYQENKILLIISLDFSGISEIQEIADTFTWKHGPKVVKAYAQKQGLRKHVLKCGGYMEEYALDAIAVFEDDIFPSPAFFNFMDQAVRYYKDDMQIAGISLYTHIWNTNCNKSFYPLSGHADIFFLQLAQSWGQIWMRQQWLDFKTWYTQNSHSFSHADHMPAYICHWPDTSWLKYHTRYCIEKNKYFVYPYEALSTNFADAGEHNHVHSTFLQAPLGMDRKKQYIFTALTQSTVIYDAFFENKQLTQNLNFSENELCIDLYGSKDNFDKKKYWLTTKEADYKIVKTYGLKLRPQELNVIMEIKGTEIKLYDTKTMQKNPRDRHLFPKCYDYYYKISRCAWKDLIKYMISTWKNKLHQHCHKR